MACFIVPATEAIVTTVATKVVEKKEKENNEIDVSFDGVNVESATEIPFSRKLKWLNHMLWGGTALLAFEHIWHGEVIPTFPFLTAASNPADTAEMLKEMSTVGVSMALIVTAVWGVMVGITSLVSRKAKKEAKRLVKE